MVPKIATKPCKPSQEEVDRHNAIHLPFRSWCDICVQGRGQEAAHRKNKDKEGHDQEMIEIDYGYTIQCDWIDKVLDSATTLNVFVLKSLD